MSRGGGFSGSGNNFLVYEKVGALETLGDALSGKGYGAKLKPSKEIFEMVKRIIDLLRIMQAKKSMDLFLQLKKEIAGLRKEINKKNAVSSGSLPAMERITENLYSLFEINIAIYIGELRPSKE